MKKKVLLGNNRKKIGTSLFIAILLIKKKLIFNIMNSSNILNMLFFL